MKEKKSIICVFITILIFMFVPAANLSCQIDLFPGETTPETEEEMSTDETGSVMENEGYENTEEEKEITSANLWIDEVVPEDISVKIRSKLTEAFDEIKIVDGKEDSDIRIEINVNQGSPAATWVLVPVVSFFRAFDDISYDDFKKFWAGDEEVLNYISADGSGPVLVLTGGVYKVLEKILGESGNENIKIVSEEELILNIEDNNSFSIIPFDRIEKKYKVLDLDGVSIFDKNLDTGNYPLTTGINVESDNPETEGKMYECFGGASITNRDIEKMTSVIMTGVTAMARQIRKRIENYGVLSPGEEIAETLKDADITHISNEIPFVEGCTGARDKDIVFCSSPEYIELLRYVGTDVIELTGNHMNDYGNEWMYYTLDMYDEEGWPYFGGGRNLAECYSAATFEINGNRIAFLGANTYGPRGNWATENTPGSARIDVYDEAQKEEDMEKFEELIKDLKKQGYIVIFTFQYEETYRYFPTETQVADFRRMIDAGADIVSGSQSHYPMGVEFRGGGFINYGLGNLFFGQQRQDLGNNPGIIAKHIFYNGKHINTVLITTMLNDFSQPRLTTPEERLELLNSIFAGSIR